MTSTADTVPLLCLPPKPLARSPRTRLPQGTVDSHFHVFREGAPFAVPRGYTPPISTLANWRTLAEGVGIARGVVVQTSVHGYDNSVLLETLQTEPDRLRGVVVVMPEITDDQVSRMHALGVRGVRCITRNPGSLGFDAAVELGRRIAPFGWTLQFLMRPEQLDDVVAIMPAVGARVVIDHMAFIDPSDPTALRKLQALLDTGHCYVKVSAAHRFSRLPDQSDFTSAAKTLIASHPERLLWGTDWPHTEIYDPDSLVDDAALIDATMSLLGTDELRRMVLVDTPNSLFFSD